MATKEGDNILKPTILVPSTLWESTWNGLALRSAGIRESACIWAGKRYEFNWHVQDVIFLDDLPKTLALQRLHRTPREALDLLFQTLRNKGMQFIADIHTHPGRWVDLSPIDKKHPIEYRIGLIAIILPFYAQQSPSLHEIGVHEYLGDNLWRRLPVPEVCHRLTIREDSI